MKKSFLLFILLFCCHFGISQTKSDDSLYVNVMETYNEELDFFNRYKKGMTFSAVSDMDKVLNANEQAAEVFKSYKKDMLACSITNVTLQKILAQGLYDNYGKYFDIKEENYIRYNFKDEVAREKSLKQAEMVMYHNFTTAMINKIDEIDKKQNAWINANLKKLGVTRKQWDDMSDTDQDILYKKFQKYITE